MAYKGKYKPKNTSKYMGNPTNCVYRSLWERKVMTWLDDNPSVLRWGSEQVIIIYRSPIDGKKHRYYVDFFMEIKDKHGKIRSVLIEVKPKKQCKPPEKPKQKSKTYINESKTWLINQAKWEAAKQVAESRGWEFQILTEDDIFKKDKK